MPSYTSIARMDRKATEQIVRVVQYNILADAYTGRFYPYCPPHVIAQHNRLRMMQQELREYQADIVCMEVSINALLRHCPTFGIILFSLF